MGRREIREEVFKLVFRVEFNSKEEMEEQVALFFTDMDADEEPKQISEKDEAYIKNKFDKLMEFKESIDKEIEEKAKGWTIGRMGKVELAIIRLAVYEIRYDDDIPTSVAINEAVELAKKFGQDDSPSFVNGVLAKFAK